MGLCSQPPRDSGPAPGPPRRTRGQGEMGSLRQEQTPSPALCWDTPFCFRHITPWLLPTFRDPLHRSRPPAGRLSSPLAPSTRSASGAHPGPASCLFRELSTWTRRASLLPSTQTAHSTRSTDLTSPQTLEQLGERFREEFCETVCNTTDFNTTVLNTICKSLNIGDLGSPQSTQEEPGRHPGGVRQWS